MQNLRKSIRLFGSKFFGIGGPEEEEEEDESETETEEKRDHWKLRRWEDLILHDDEGKPYIDVNKLVYNPKRRRAPPHVKWNTYIPDYLFFFSNIFGEMVYVFVFTVGLELSVWNTNIETIMAQHQPKHKDHDQDHALIPGPPGHKHRMMGDSHDDSLDPGFGVLRFEGFDGLRSSEGRSSGGSVGIFLICLSFVYTMNLFFGCFAFLRGYKWGLILHIIIDIIIALVEIILTVMIIHGSRCEPEDLKMVKHAFDDMIRIWALPRITTKKRFDHHYAMLLLDQIQSSLQCCGSSNWTDYVNDGFVHNNNFKQGSNSSDETVFFFTGNTKFFHIPANKAFPYSCCKPWWVRNIHCSENVHEWVFPNASKLDRFKFRERISQVGCVPQIWSSCLKLLHRLSKHLREVGIILFFLLLIKIVATVWELQRIKQKSKEKTLHFESDEIPAIAIPKHWEEDSEEELMEKKRRKKKGVRRRKAILMSRIDLEAAEAGAENLNAEELPNPYKLQLNDLREKVPAPKEDEINYVRARTPFAHFEIRMGHTRVGHLITLARDVMAMDGSSSQKHRHTMEFFEGEGATDAHMSVTSVQRDTILEEFELLEDKQGQASGRPNPKGAPTSEFNWSKGTSTVESKPDANAASLHGHGQKKRRISPTNGPGEALFKQTHSSWKDKVKDQDNTTGSGGQPLKGTQANTNVSASKPPVKTPSPNVINKKGD